MVVNRSALIRTHLEAQAPGTAREVRRAPFRHGLELPVILVPTKDLLYNPSLGRLILARLRDPKRLSNPEEAEAQDAIQKELLSHRETEALAKHIKDEGQLEPGIVSSDGVLVNGNRRLAVLRQLWDDTKEDRFHYMKVAVLPADTTPPEMYLLEVTLQMTPETRARYGPITTLVQLREGLQQHHLDKDQLARAMYKTAEELGEQIDILQLVDEYLKFVKRPRDYLHLEGDLTEAGHQGKFQHFFELNRLREKHEKKRFWSALKRHVFQMIRAGCPFDEIRILKSWNDHGDIALFAQQLGGVAESPTTAGAPAHDLDALAEALAGVENATGKKGVATITLPVPPEPTRPDARGEAELAKDPEVRRTLDAMRAVNEVATARKASRRPAELLRKALRCLEAAAAVAVSDSADAAEVKTLLRNIERLSGKMLASAKKLRAASRGSAAQRRTTRTKKKHGR